MPQCSGAGGAGGGGVGVGGGLPGGECHAQARSSFVDKIHGITDKLHHSLGGHLSHDPSKTGKHDASTVLSFEFYFKNYCMVNFETSILIIYSFQLISYQFLPGGLFTKLQYLCPNPTNLK